MGETVEYPNRSGIKIRTRLNGSSYGESYQVDIPSGVSGSKRIRKQFPNLVKAKAYAETVWQNTKRVGRGLKNLTDQEIAEYSLFAPKLRNAGYSLGEALEFALSRMRPKDARKSLSELVRELLEGQKEDLDAEQISYNYYEDSRKRKTFLLNHIGEIELSDITRDVIFEFFKCVKKTCYSNKRNYFRHFTALMKYAVNEGYILSNPFAEFTDADKKRCIGRKTAKDSEVHIFTVTEARELLEDAFKYQEQYHLLGNFVVRLFCGIRAREASLLTWDDIRMDDDDPYISVSARIAKGRFQRNPDIPPNAVKWLSLLDKTKPFSLTADKGDKAGQHYENLWKGFCLATGRWKYKKGIKRRSIHSNLVGRNLLRHSFATYHYDCHGEALRTAAQMGHKQSDDLLFSTYRSLVRKGEGKKYFNIAPKPSASKIIKMPRTA